MPDTPNPDLADLVRQFTKLAEDVYARGFTDGGMAMRDNILQAASAPTTVRGSSPFQGAIQSLVGTRAPVTRRLGPGAPIVRAPRGSVPNAIRRALEEKPGATSREVVDLVKIIDPSVAGNSVANELKRKENTLYVRVDGGWHFAGEEPAKKSTGWPSMTAPADNFNHEPKGGEA